jgi:hypothetical protein
MVDKGTIHPQSSRQHRLCGVDRGWEKIAIDYAKERMEEITV